jgi:hypothetical protein
MSLFHYIGANRELPGIYIEPLHNRNIVIKKHFESTYVYGIAANWGGFFLNSLMKKDFPEDYKCNVKCIKELFRLMQDYGADGDEFELYSCWYDEEHEARDDSLTAVIDLRSFTVQDNFQLKDKQYIKVKL